jgi:hypothetical protein
MGKLGLGQSNSPLGAFDKPPITGMELPDFLSGHIFVISHFW